MSYAAHADAESEAHIPRKIAGHKHYNTRGVALALLGGRTNKMQPGRSI
jgi:hypothetical protein